jgi:hypothetical protein
MGQVNLEKPQSFKSADDLLDYLVVQSFVSLGYINLFLMLKPFTFALFSAHYSVPRDL